ncbi:MAG: GNAT family N-acetyltransferase [Promethearchaeota archaeon]|nr:MAG: GNAT family N-acetyltransferase [Candidatus Lokiarchaeota archaeon]
MIIEKFSMNLYEEVIEIWRKAGISVGSTDTKEELERMLQRNPDLFLIGKIDNKVISVVMGGFDGRRGYVHHLAVDPDYQKKGYGKILMDELMKKLLEMKVHKVHLFIEKYNKDVVEFYKYLGWEIREDLIMMSFIPDTNLYKMNI